MAKKIQNRIKPMSRENEEEKRKRKGKKKRILTLKWIRACVYVLVHLVPGHEGTAELGFVLGL